MDVAAVLAAVRVEVTALAAVTSAEAGLTPHVTGLVAPAGPLTVQVNATSPVKPFDGVTLIVEVFPDVAPAVRLNVDGLLLSA